LSSIHILADTRYRDIRRPFADADGPGVDVWRKAASGLLTVIKAVKHEPSPLNPGDGYLYTHRTNDARRESTGPLHVMLADGRLAKT